MKHGRLRKEEQTFILEHMSKSSPREIAIALGRRQESVVEFIKRSSLQPKVEEKIDLVYNIETRPFWNSIKKQFNDEEIKIFKQDWIKTIRQFGDDVTHTEEKQIVQSCTLTIMMYRTLEELEIVKQKLEEFQKQYGIELSKPDRNKDILIQLDNQIASMRIATGTLTSQYDKYFRNQRDLQKDLKATRDQRIDKLDISETTFADWLRVLNDEKKMLEISKEAELHRVAMYKNYLLTGAQLYKYEDGSLDQPILNSETIELLPREKEIERKVQEINK